MSIVNNKRLIGIFGGRFDPIHIGHIRFAIEALERLNLDQVRFIPAKNPPHRPPAIVPADVRLEMVKQALMGLPENNGRFIADNRELLRSGNSYMVDTLADLRDEFTEDSICLLLGMDAFLELESWHKWQSLLDFANFVVVDRPLQDQSKLTPALSELYNLNKIVEPRELLDNSNGKVLFFSAPQLDISATAIRNSVANCSYLLPHSVLEIIKVNKLYGR